MQNGIVQERSVYLFYSFIVSMLSLLGSHYSVVIHLDTIFMGNYDQVKPIKLGVIHGVFVVVPSR